MWAPFISVIQWLSRCNGDLFVDFLRGSANLAQLADPLANYPQVQKSLFWYPEWLKFRRWRWKYPTSLSDSLQSVSNELSICSLCLCNPPSSLQLQYFYWQFLLLVFFPKELILQHSTLVFHPFILSSSTDLNQIKILFEMLLLSVEFNQCRRHKQHSTNGKVYCKTRGMA